VIIVSSLSKKLTLQLLSKKKNKSTVFVSPQSKPSFSAPPSVSFAGGGFVVVFAVVLLFRRGLWCFRPVFALVLFNLFRFASVLTYLVVALFRFCGGLVNTVFSASVFEYASVRSVFRWCGCFNAAGGVGVSTTPVVLVFQRRRCWCFMVRARVLVI
jgi:hypothetical protein